MGDPERAGARVWAEAIHYRYRCLCLGAVWDGPSYIYQYWYRRLDEDSRFQKF